MDGTGRSWSATISKGESGGLTIELAEPLPGQGGNDGHLVTLLFGLTKAGGPEHVIRSATEVGVTCFVPLVTARSVPRPKPGRPGKLARWRKVALEAARQSGRRVPPDVLEPMDLAPAMALPQVFSATYKLCFSLSPGVHHLSDAGQLKGDTAIAVGPEGGFTREEEESMLAAGFETVSLGPYTLRAVTAGIVAPALVLLGGGVSK